MKKIINLRFTIICSLILLAVLSRLFPHMPNFSPLGAIGLFGAAYFSQKKYALLIPIIALWLSDLFLNNFIYREYYTEFVWFYDGFYWQYISLILSAVLGIVIFRKVTLSKIILGSFSTSLIFFLLSNFGVWLSGHMYPLNISGLIQCYIAGIPFIKGTILGDLFYSFLLFGTFEFAKNKIQSLRLSYN